MGIFGILNNDGGSAKAGRAKHTYTQGGRKIDIINTHRGNQMGNNEHRKEDDQWVKWRIEHIHRKKSPRGKGDKNTYTLTEVYQRGIKHTHPQALFPYYREHE